MTLYGNVSVLWKHSEKKLRECPNRLLDAGLPRLGKRVIVAHVQQYILHTFGPAGALKHGGRNFYTPSRSLSRSLIARLIPSGAFRDWCAGAHPTKVLMKSLVLGRTI